MYANRCQIFLRASCIEITREPVSENAHELFPYSSISGVIPIYQQSTVGYRFPVMTIVRLLIDDGNVCDIELQEVTNQLVWSNGDISGLMQAVNEINKSLAQETKFLDLYPGAAVAYSLNRRLRTAYRGHAFRVVRSNDGAVSDIDFLPDGNIDTASLLNFVGPFDAVIDILYDQSGNGNNLTQVFSSARPIVVENGAPIIRNGFLCMRHSSGTTTMILSSPLAIAANFTSIMVSIRAAAGSIGMRISSIGGNVFTTWHYSDDNIYTRGDTGYIVSNSADTKSFLEILVGVYNVTNKKQYKNTNQVASTFNAAVSPQSFEHLHGEVGSLFSEAVIYSSDKSTTLSAMQLNVLNYYDILPASDTGYLLDENGTFILDEDGTKILNG